MSNDAAVKERPILMSGPMVKAILDGRKTQTRRVVKPQPPDDFDRHCWFDAPAYGWTNEPEPAINWFTLRCRHGLPGERLYIREKWALVQWDEDGTDDWTGSIPKEPPGLGWSAHHAAGSTYENDCLEDRGFRWRPSIHMPRWAARIIIEVTGVRVERIQDISDADAIAEGIRRFDETAGQSVYTWYGVDRSTDRNPIGAYRTLWESIHGPGSWDANPWVWAVEFRRIEP